MPLYKTVAMTLSTTLSRLIGRLLARALIAALGIVAIYQFTVAGTLALDAEYGTWQSRLIVGAIYSVVALAGAAIFWATRNRTASGSTPPVLGGAREMHLAMLIEAVMLGYALARKSDRAP